MFFQPGLGGHIKYATNTHSSVHQHPTGAVGSATPLPLQHMVHGAGHIFGVLKNTGQRVIHPRRGDKLVALGHRLEEVTVHGFVKGKHAPVEGLPGILRVTGLTLLLRGLRLNQLHRQYSNQYQQ